MVYLLPLILFTSYAGAGLPSLKGDSINEILYFTGLCLFSISYYALFNRKRHVYSIISRMINFVFWGVLGQLTLGQGIMLLFDIPHSMALTWWRGIHVLSICILSGGVLATVLSFREASIFGYIFGGLIIPPYLVWLWGPGQYHWLRDLEFIDLGGASGILIAGLAMLTTSWVYHQKGSKFLLGINKYPHVFSTRIWIFSVVVGIFIIGLISRLLMLFHESNQDNGLTNGFMLSLMGSYAAVFMLKKVLGSKVGIRALIHLPILSIILYMGKINYDQWYNAIWPSFLASIVWVKYSQNIRKDIKYRSHFFIYAGTVSLINVAVGTGASQAFFQLRGVLITFVWIIPTMYLLLTGIKFVFRYIIHNPEVSDSNDDLDLVA